MSHLGREIRKSFKKGLVHDNKNTEIDIGVKAGDQTSRIVSH